MSEVKGVEVNILGRAFTIACPEDERAALLAAVAYLDKKMNDIQDSGRVVGSERVAVMAALNLSHEVLTARNGNFDVGDFKRSVLRMNDKLDAALAPQDKLL
ncbi:cell division protein ZapA [Pseudomethylobacillus aquaticus]|uniref:Cell division protein ZapA n=1 Tax=Pseudomethylobacillus aquaticus TaxID=2676064 RepID=A0A3N0UZK4_9PROT|nr:cell division protein ZapA [Pseudomethylobacillus aquaticus]ROH85792.1 cell division protein ZapA [Pseudomethylobacillus aquaticus]